MPKADRPLSAVQQPRLMHLLIARAMLRICGCYAIPLHLGSNGGPQVSARGW